MKNGLMTLVVALLWNTPVFAAGEFKLDPIACNIGTVAEINFSDSFVSKVQTQLEFTGASIKMPRLRLIFLEHEPAHVAIHFESIVTERKKQLWFKEAMIDRIRLEENMPFLFRRVNPGQAAGGAIFESEPLDFARAQDLVALFLSQTAFVIDAGPVDGMWHGSQHLTGTDSSYRQMAATCFPQLSAAYLRSSGRAISQPRVKGLSPVAAFYSEGYGLTEFSWIQDMLPAELRHPHPVLPKDSTWEDSDLQLASVYNLAQQKRQALAAFSQASADKKYLELDTSLTGSYQHLTEVYNRFSLLTGKSDASTDGLIALKMKEQADLTASISRLSAQIAQTTQALDQTGQDLTGAQATVAPYLQQLGDFAAQIKALDDRSGEIMRLQQHLVELLNDESEALIASSNEPLPQAPWSVEEIEAHKNENRQRSANIEMISRLKGELESIALELPALLEKATAQQAAYMAYIALGVEVQNLRNALTQEERWLQKRTAVPGFSASDETFAALNADIEAKMAAQNVVRQFDSEFDFYSASFNSASAEFTSLAAQAKTGPASLFSAVLCPASVLLDPASENRACLTVDEAVDPQISQTFFYTLPPETLEYYLPQVIRPWDQDTSKVDLLWNQYQQEIAQNPEPMAGLIAKWNEIRFIIWRWDRMQAEADAFAPCPDPKPMELFTDKTYSAAFYERVYQCQKSETAAHQAERQRLLEAFGAAKSGMDQAFVAFEQADEAFDTASRGFVTGALKGITTASDSPDVAGITTFCILPLKDSESCAANVQNSVSLVTGRLTQEQAALLDVAKALVLNIRGRAAVFAEEYRATVEQTQAVQRTRSDFMAANGVDAMLAARDGLQAKLDETKRQLAALNAEKSQSAGRLTSSMAGESTLRAEAAQLAAEIQMTADTIRAVMPEFNQFCDPILTNLKNVEVADQGLFHLLAPNTPAPEPQIYSSCQRPSLDGFAPNRQILVTHP